MITVASSSIMKAVRSESSSVKSSRNIMKSCRIGKGEMIDGTIAIR